MLKPFAKLFVPVQLLLPFNNATFVLNLASGTVPLVNCEALRLVKPEPSPANPGAVIVPEKFGLPLSKATEAGKLVAASTPVTVPALAAYVE